MITIQALRGYCAAFVSLLSYNPKHLYSFELALLIQQIIVIILAFLDLAGDGLRPRAGRNTRGKTLFSFQQRF